MKKCPYFLTIAFALILFAIVPDVHAQGRALPTQAPVGATLVSPSGSILTNKSTYNWNAVFDTTWYYLWVSRVNGDGSLTTVHTKWYTSAEACVAGTCSITPDVALSAGNYRWWIETWNESGYGPWSSGMDFAPTVPAAATLS